MNVDRFLHGTLAWEFLVSTAEKLPLLYDK
jgi:hypothetical protein